MAGIVMTALCLTPASLCFAQGSTGNIDVTITDHSGAVIPGAQITITGSDTGVLLRKLTTNASGIAQVPLVPPGHYNVDVVKDGFKSLHRDVLDIQVGATVTLDLALDLGETSETITVSGQTPLIESKSQTLQQVIEEKELTDIPLNGRNYLEAANYLPGVVPQNSGRDNSFVAYGNNGLQNAFLLDGARNVNYLRGLDNQQRDAIRPPLDALAQFTVQTSNYSAEFGASAGAVVNAITKNGTNAWHGSVYDFIRNSAADAKTYFSTAVTAKALLVRNQYGGSFGGPIRRDKLFFFAAYEGIHNRSEGYNQTQVPTALERAGDFSKSVNASGAVVPIYDPSTLTQAGTAYTRRQFAGNIIPASRFNAIGLSLLQLYPLPNLQVGLTNYYASNVPSRQDQKNSIGRVDFTPSDRDSFFGRYAYTLNDNYSGVALPNAQDPANTTTVSQGLGVGFTRVISPRVINEARFAWTTVGISAAGLMPRNEIIPGLLDPAITAGMPNVNVQNRGGIGAEAVNNSPLYKSAGVFDFADNLTWSRGKHLFKFGGETMWIRPNTQAALGGRGSLSFTGVFTQLPSNRNNTGSGTADLLLGFASAVNTGTVLRSEERAWYYAGYFNDQWEATPNLTLNFGLRYEYLTPFWDTQNRLANLVLDPGPLYGQFVVAGDSRLPRALVYADKNNVAPRLGFAYQVPNVNNFTIRGSFGTFYAQDQGSGITSRLSSNPPFYNYGAISLASDQLRTSTGFTLSPNTSIPRPTPVNPAGFALSPTFTGGLTTWPTHARLGYVNQWSLSLQKQIVWRMLAEANYVGNHGIHLLSRQQGNQPTVLNATTVQSRRPLSAITQSTINQIGDGNATQYEGLSAQLSKRFSHGVSFRNSFTYGHTFDLQSQSIDTCDSCSLGDTFQNAYDHASNWGSADSDIRFRYALSGIAQLPTAPGTGFLPNNRIVAGVLGGWALAPIFSFQTGRPITAGLGADTANAGTLTRPNQICDPNKGGAHTLQTWFNTTCLAAPPAFTFGNMAKGNIRLPNNLQFNLSAQRNFPLPHFHESNLNFRLDAFNLLNHAQFNSVNATLGNSNYGNITGSGPSRQLQAAVRLTF